MDSRSALRLQYILLIGIFLVTALIPLLPKQEIFTPVVRIWSAQSLATFSRDYSTLGHEGFLSLASKNRSPVLSAGQISFVLFFALFLVSLYGLICLNLELGSLRHICKDSYLVRRLGRVSIYTNDLVAVPFSFWLPGLAAVVMPTTLLNRIADFKIGVFHELQHHRQKDTQWVYVLWFLRILCFANPFIHLWTRWISELQEFACDETLVDLKRVESQQYARCLIQVAETALNQRIEE